MAANSIYRPYPTALPEGRRPYQDLATSADTFGAAEARGAQALAQGIAPWGDLLARHGLALRDQDNETAVKEADTAFTRDLIDLTFNPEKGYYTLSGKAALDAMPGTLDQAKALKEKYVGGLSNKRAQEMFGRAADARLTQTIEGMSSHAAKERRAWIQDTGTARIAMETDNAVAYWNDDENFALSLGVIGAEVAEQGAFLGWSEDQIKAATLGAEGTAWELRIKRAAQDSIQGAAALLENNRDAIPGETQVRLSEIISSAKAQAEAQARQEQALLRASVAAQLDDWTTDIRVNGVIPVTAEAQVRIAYSDDPETAEALIGAMRREQEYYGVRKQVGSQSIDEKQQTQAAFEDAIGGVHASEELTRAADYAKAASQDTDSLLKDPALNVMRNFPELQQAWEAAMKSGDPKDTAVAIALSDQLQERKGVAPWDRRIFTTEQAKVEVSAFAFMSGSSDERQSGALAAAQRIDQLAAQYGPAWPRAYGELVGAGMPEAAQVIAAFSGVGIDRPFRDRLIAAMNLGEQALEKAAGDNARLVNDAVTEQIAGLTGTFGTSPGSIMPYRQAAYLVALMGVARGQDPEDAAAEALAPLVGAAGRYAVSDNGEYRIPAPDLNDKELIAQGVAAAIEALPTMDLSPYGSPNPVIQAEAGYVAEQYSEAVARDHHWVTAPGEDGLLLTDGAYQPVMRGGQQVFFSWDALMDWGQAARPPVDSGVPVAPTPFGTPMQMPTPGIEGSSGTGRFMGGEDDMGLLPEEYILGDLGYQRSDQPGFVMGGIASLRYGKDKAGPGQRDEPTAAERTAQMMARPAPSSPDMPGYARAGVSRETLAALRYIKDENPPPPRPGEKITLPMPGVKPPVPLDPPMMSSIPVAEVAGADVDHLLANAEARGSAVAQPVQINYAGLTFDTADVPRLIRNATDAQVAKLAKAPATRAAAEEEAAFRDMFRASLAGMTQDELVALRAAAIANESDVLDITQGGIMVKNQEWRGGRAVGTMIDEALAIRTRQPSPIPSVKPPMPADYAGAVLPAETLAFPGYHAGMAIRMAPNGALQDVAGKDELTWRKEYGSWLREVPDSAVVAMLGSLEGSMPMGGMVMPVASTKIRSDEAGHGEFHASRPANKSGLHEGVDIEAVPGELVYAPVSGTVTKLGTVYPGDSVYQYVEVFTDDKRNVRLLYVLPGAFEGQRVTAGISVLGAAQDVSLKHGGGMKAHVHVEVREDGAPRSKKKGKPVDPWPLLTQGTDVALAMLQTEAARRGIVQLAKR